MLLVLPCQRSVGPAPQRRQKSGRQQSFSTFLWSNGAFRRCRPSDIRRRADLSPLQGRNLLLLAERGPRCACHPLISLQLSDDSDSSFSNAGAWSAVYLLVCYSPIEDGGLGLQSSQTGLTLACTGVWSLVFQFAFLPPVRLPLFSRSDRKISDLPACLASPSFNFVSGLSVSTRPYVSGTPFSSYSSLSSTGSLPSQSRPRHPKAPSSASQSGPVSTSLCSSPSLFCRQVPSS